MRSPSIWHAPPRSPCDIESRTKVRWSEHFPPDPDPFGNSNSSWDSSQPSKISFCEIGFSCLAEIPEVVCNGDDSCRNISPASQLVVKATSNILQSVVKHLRRNEKLDYRYLDGNFDRHDMKILLERHVERVRTLDDVENALGEAKLYVRECISSQVANEVRILENMIAAQRRRSTLTHQMLSSRERNDQNKLQEDLVKSQISENRKAIEHASTMKRLTAMAFIFIPASTVCGFFGMNLQGLNQSGKPMKTFWTTLAIVLSITIGFAALHPLYRAPRYLEAAISKPFDDAMNEPEKGQSSWQRALTPLWRPWQEVRDSYKHIQLQLRAWSLEVNENKESENEWRINVTPQLIEFLRKRFRLDKEAVDV